VGAAFTTTKSGEPTNTATRNPCTVAGVCQVVDFLLFFLFVVFPLAKLQLATKTKTTATLKTRRRWR